MSATDTKENIKIKKSEIAGYALGDFGSCLLFGLVQSVLQKYYTDILRINVISIMVMMVVARIWDAVNDIICGRIIDADPFHGTDRYRTWIKVFAIPVALSSCLMFLNIPGLSAGGYLAFAYVTYILFGMLYTCINIPYGTLAYSMSNSAHDSVKLSAARSVGSVFGALPAMLLISFAYSVKSGKKVMNYNKVMTGVVVISLLAVVALYLTYRLTNEKKTYAKSSGKFDLTSLSALLHSRPYIAVCIAGMLFLAAQMFSQAYNSYLFDYYFNAPQFTMLPTICQYLPAAIMMLFLGKLTKKHEARQVCAVGLYFSGICNMILFLFFKKSILFYILFSLLGGFGSACIFLLLWALVNEAFKFNEEHLGFRDHATAYAIFLFMRKIGQSIEAILVNASLNRIGYVENVLNVEKLSSGTLDSMFSDSVLIPAVLYIAAALALSFKQKTEKNK